MTLCVDKQEMRLILKAKRAAITVERRTEAAQTLVSACLPLLKTFKTVLSFHSLPQEIDTAALNALLAKQKKLLLPKVSDNFLEVYQVNDSLNDLKPNSWELGEPDPTVCPRVELEMIDCILVPGLGFDKQRHRIGYGKGFYDRLLEQIVIPTQTIGVGFKEQFVEEGLSYEPHDVALDKLVLC